jgi:hypothetical protein
MTKKFDTFITTVIEDMDAGGMEAGGVLGNDGEYDTTDARTAYVAGMYTRQGRRKIKKKKRRKK